MNKEYVSFFLEFRKTFLTSTPKWAIKPHSKQLDPKLFFINHEIPESSLTLPHPLSPN